MDAVNDPRTVAPLLVNFFKFNYQLLSIAEKRYYLIIVNISTRVCMIHLASHWHWPKVWARKRSAGHKQTYSNETTQLHNQRNQASSPMRILLRILFWNSSKFKAFHPVAYGDGQRVVASLMSTFQISWESWEYTQKFLIITKRRQNKTKQNYLSWHTHAKQNK